MRALVLFIMMLVSVFFCETTSFAQAAGDTNQTATQPLIDKRKLLVPPRNADGTIQMTPFWENPAQWIMEQQRSFYGAMSGSLRQMRRDNTNTAAWTLMLLSFAYGIFHAAGPGHGKAVISAWLLATENELRRGIVIAFLSSIIQGLTAIAVVSLLLLLVTSVGATARNVAGILESASYAMIAGMGLYLVWTAVRPRQPATAATHTIAPLQLAEAPAAQFRVAAENYRFNMVDRPLPLSSSHVHDENCGCGHAHLPDASQVRGEWSLAKAFSLAFAVGIRPCTGAILVLIFANVAGLYWAGVASTMMMAFGTFLTVSAIAAVAVYSKKLALRFAGRDGRFMGWLASFMRIGGGLVIACLGLMLFWGSLHSVNNMM